MTFSIFYSLINGPIPINIQYVDANVIFDRCSLWTYHYDETKEELETKKYDISYYALRVGDS